MLDVIDIHHPFRLDDGIHHTVIANSASIIITQSSFQSLNLWAIERVALKRIERSSNFSIKRRG